ncbi:MAG: homoserine O-acetyltransferase/O-succinyltransferase family protein [Trebonia sp.]
MTVLAARAAGARFSRPLEVALVNNMPDAAFVDTERQFRSMLASAASNMMLRLYTMNSIPRSEQTTALVRSRYRSLESLWGDAPDALIVTGTEPRAADLRDEPFWPELARLLEWAADTVPTVLVSCLAAQAAVLLFDGIERLRRPAKCAGVFPGEVHDDPHGLTEGLPRCVLTPHSRINDIPEAALETAGYGIVIGGGGSPAGWAVASRDCGYSSLVLCQGHPEYGRLSLLREYRRDVRRFLLGAGKARYPALPQCYLEPKAVQAMERFRVQAMAAKTESAEELMGTFPYDEIADGVQNTWAATSAILYTNWIAATRTAALLAA